MDYQHILVEIEERVAVITLNRPEVLNGMTQIMNYRETVLLDYVSTNYKCGDLSPTAMPPVPLMQTHFYLPYTIGQWDVFDLSIYRWRIDWNKPKIKYLSGLDIFSVDAPAGIDKRIIHHRHIGSVFSAAKIMQAFMFAFCVCSCSTSGNLI